MAVKGTREEGGFDLDTQEVAIIDQGSVVRGCVMQVPLIFSLGELQKLCKGHFETLCDSLDLIPVYNLIFLGRVFQIVKCFLIEPRQS